MSLEAETVVVRNNGADDLPSDGDLGDLRSGTVGRWLGETIRKRLAWVTRGETGTVD